VFSPKRRLLVPLVAVAVATASTSAFGQAAAPPPPAAPASEKAELTAAAAAAKAKDWAGALAHYQAAMQAASSARAQLGVADSLYQLGRLGEAYEAYFAAQRDYAAKLAPGEKAQVAARLKELAAKTGWLSVRLSEAGAAVELDGKPMGTSPLPTLVRVPSGSHEVHATKAGFAPFTARADVAPDGSAVVEANLAAEVTQARVAVTTSGEPLRVLVDGVDVGGTPWEGDVAPGMHEIGGRTSSAQAVPQNINVKAGDRVAVELVSAATAAHLQVRTNEGKGVIFVDGVMRAEGAFAMDLAPGQHTIAVTRDGYERFEKTATVGPRDTWAETVTLKPVAATGGEVEAADRPIAGTYGGLGFLALFGMGGQGTELETNCDTLGAASCETPSPVGGGLFAYFGYTWDPVGFELFLAATGDTAKQTAHFDGKTGAQPFSTPARDETFTFLKGGGVGALRVRATFQTRRIRGTFAAGPGISYRLGGFKRDAVTTDGTDMKNVWVPGLVSYASPAVSAEGALHLRLSGAFAIALGLELLVENASTWGSTATESSNSQKLFGVNQLPTPIATPGYHLASGPQVMIGPFLGMAFGP
jgi:hypothetical protein